VRFEISIGWATSNLITGHTTPAEAVEDIRAGTWSKPVAALRAATGDEAARLKKSLPAFLWSGKFTARKNDGLVQHSGLLCADIDNVVERVGHLHDIARNDAHVAAAFVSPSGTGIKTVFRVPVPADARQHQQNFNAVRAHVTRNYGAKVDEAAKDVARLCFVSHDPAAFYNADAVPLDVAPMGHPENCQNLLPVNGTAMGSRNNAAFELACQCRDRGQTTAQVQTEVRNFAARCQPPLPEAEVEICVRSAFAHTPRPENLSEFEFANLLAAKLPPIKTVGPDWFAYSAGAWQKISRATLRPVAQDILPPNIRTARRESTLLDHLEGRCQVAPDVFRGFYRFGDAGEILINAANGIVRVTASQSSELLPHDDEHLFTQRTAARFDPQASADLFQKTLAELLPDELDRDLLQLCFGNFLLPDCRFEVALVCYGEAGGGKSTIAEPISAALGSDLVARLAMSQICDPRSYHLPKLRYAAVNLGTELDVIAIDESANFKTIVSGEPVEARPIYGEPFTMQTGCKLWFLANGLPRFKNGTEAELRRTRFIRFDSRPAVKDVTLKSRLLCERDGVFNFMLTGLQRLLTVAEIPLGGVASQSVHARFKISNDPLGTFVAQQCEFAPEAREPKSEIKTAFSSFCETHGLPVEFGDWFFKRLYERFTNLKEIRASYAGERVRCISGIKLKSRIATD
jgi:P4 family phage/plasmid primase-like protien